LVNEQFPQNDNFRFQQNGVKFHSTMNIVKLIALFPKRVIFISHLYQQTACDDILLRYLKSKVNTQKSWDVEELKNKIQEEIANTPLEVIHCVVKKIWRRLEKCLRKFGNYLEEKKKRMLCSLF